MATRPPPSSPRRRSSSLARRRPRARRAGDLAAGDRRLGGRGRAGVFAVFAAPVVLCGSADVRRLHDARRHRDPLRRSSTASLTHGDDLASVSGPRRTAPPWRPTSDSGYPPGAHAALARRQAARGHRRRLGLPAVPRLLAADLALTLSGCSQGVDPRRWRSAAVVALAAQPALVYAYALQGSVKELATRLARRRCSPRWCPAWRRTCREAPRRALPLALATRGARASSACRSRRGSRRCC